jgi:hypothetical protein
MPARRIAPHVRPSAAGSEQSRPKHLAKARTAGPVCAVRTFRLQRAYSDLQIVRIWHKETAERIRLCCQLTPGGFQLRPPFVVARHGQPKLQRQLLRRNKFSAPAACVSATSGIRGVRHRRAHRRRCGERREDRNGSRLESERDQREDLVGCRKFAGVVRPKSKEIAAGRRTSGPQVIPYCLY